MTQKLGIGIVGAGDWARRVHIPRLRQLKDVEVVAVSNRSWESTQRVAAEFSIPNAIKDWRELVQREDIHAVIVATPPYMHHPVTMAALEAGKHVLCHASLAMDHRQAREMLEKARQKGLVGGYMPSSSYLPGSAEVKRFLSEGRIGRLNSVLFFCRLGSWLEPGATFSWKHTLKEAPAGQILISPTIAINRWFPGIRRVFATTSLFIRERPLAAGKGMAKVTTPDYYSVMMETTDGAQITLQSGLTRVSVGGYTTYFFGSEGTMVYFSMKNPPELWVGRAEDGELKPVPLPKDRLERWTAEADFVRAIREGAPMKPDFEDGVREAEIMTAALTSAREERWVSLPLSP